MTGQVIGVEATVHLIVWLFVPYLVWGWLQSRRHTDALLCGPSCLDSSRPPTSCLVRLTVPCFGPCGTCRRCQSSAIPKTMTTTPKPSAIKRDPVGEQGLPAEG